VHDCLRGINPDVIVDFMFHDGIFHITVENIGNSPAYRISVAFDREISGAGAKPINEMALFQDLAFLPPGKRIASFLDSSASYFTRGQPTDVNIRVVFHDRWGRKRSNQIRHNLGVYRDLGYAQNRHADT
jgi:hypothetical protein